MRAGISSEKNSSSRSGIDDSARRLPSLRERSERWGGVGGGGHVLQSVNDDMHDAFNISEHVVVPESQHAVSIVTQISLPLAIAKRVLGLAMLSAVKFDDHPRRVACEIRKIRSDGCLASKMRSLDFNSTQVPPQLSFGVSHVAARATRAWHAFVFTARRTHYTPPTPDPSPPLRGGRGAGRLRIDHRPFCRYAAGAGGASVLCVPSQVGFLPLRLQAQKAISPAAAALYSTGENSEPLCEPSQNGCFLERPQAHHQ